MQVKTIDPLEDPRWDDFVLTNKYGSIYHLSAWRALIEKTFGHKPLYLILQENGDRIKAALPLFFIKSWLTGNRLVSLPFCSFCDPIVESTADLNRLLNTVFTIQKESNSKYVEIRTKKNLAVFKGTNFKPHCLFKSHILRLSNESDKLFHSFHKTSIQQRIRRATRNNVIVRKALKLTDMKIFYSLHIQVTKRHGVAPRPYRFFKNLWEISYPNGLVDLFFAQLNNRIIGGLILLKFRDTAYYEYVGTDYRFLKYNTNHIILWKAIEDCCKTGLKYFDFGVSPIRNRGLMDFKRRWGAEENDLFYFYFPDIMGYKKFTKYHSEKIAVNSRKNCLNRIKAKINSSMVNIAGRFLYHHFG